MKRLSKEFFGQVAARYRCDFKYHNQGDILLSKKSIFKEIAFWEEHFPKKKDSADRLRVQVASALKSGDDYKIHEVYDGRDELFEELRGDLNSIAPKGTEYNFPILHDCMITWRGFAPIGFFPEQATGNSDDTFQDILEGLNWSFGKYLEMKKKEAADGDCKEC